MRRERGAEYVRYSERTPFMLPLPGFLARLGAFPTRLVLGKALPETGREVAILLAIYTGIFVVLSAPFVLFHWPPGSIWWGFPYNIYPFR